MPQSASRSYTPQQVGILARAARAHEDPHQMTAAATAGRLAKYAARALEKNPGLTPEQARKAGRQLLRADMIRLAAKSAQVRKAAGNAA